MNSGRREGGGGNENSSQESKDNPKRLCGSSRRSRRIQGKKSHVDFIRFTDVPVLPTAKTLQRWL